MTNTRTPTTTPALSYADALAQAAPYTVELAQATDRKLADLHRERESAANKLSAAADAIHYAVGDERARDRQGLRRGPWALTLEACLAMPAERSYNADALARNVALVADYRAQLAVLDGRIAALDAVYAAHRWPRFFLVTSSDGHIHSSTACSTCHLRTRFGWLPDLSGLDEAAAVAAHGAKLCTVCYPTAPVEWTNFFDSAAATRKAAQCPGSGRSPDRLRRNWCPVCGKYSRPTRNGYTRAHVAPVAK